MQFGKGWGDKGEIFKRKSMPGSQANSRKQENGQMIDESKVYRDESRNVVFKKVVIIGVGLIGGSLGLALCNRRLAENVIGVGRNEENLRLALQYGAIHQASTDFTKTVADAEIVILAAHPKANLELLAKVAPFLSTGTIVTDVGSVKGDIVALASRLIPPGSFFVGGHPMAGSERQGIAGADPYLFENAFYIITPFSGAPFWVLEKIRVMTQCIGARVIEMTPEEHDLAIAALSHLPHLVASALVNTLAVLPEGERYLPLAAGGFRDTTRIALSDPEMWRDIFIANRDMLLLMLKAFKQEIDLLEDAVKSTAENKILNVLQRAKAIRENIPAKTKGYLPILHEILVTIPDRPGTIAHMAKIMAQEEVNIADIEILRVREGEGGSVRVGFRTEKEQKKAVSSLRKAGVQVVERK